MRGPSSVCDGDLRQERLRCVDTGFCDLLAETSDFADFLEEEHFTWLVAIDANTGRVVTAILLTSEAIAKDFANRLAVLERRERMLE